MAKLASARDSRAYGPRPAQNRWEYINAAVYVFAAILLLGGFSAQLSPGQLDDKSGLVIILIGIGFLLLVNAHDFIAHMAGIDHCIALVEFDPQLALVEFAVPVVMMVGSVLAFMGVLLFFIEMEKGYSYRLEKHGLNLLIAAPVFWVLGSIHNLCQVYERANGHVQILQNSVQIPFLMGSLMFLVGGIFNRHDAVPPMILARSGIWLCVFGSLLFLIGGLMNVVKVFKIQQMGGGRLEKLRGGALERLIREREGTVPLILEENRRRREEPRQPVEEPMPSRQPVEEPRPSRRPAEEPRAQPPVLTTPYKDVLLGGSSNV